MKTDMRFVALIAARLEPESTLSDSTRIATSKNAEPQPITNKK